MIKKKLILLFSIFLPILTYSQEVGMADALRENGKIYIVVIVVSIIVLGLFGFLLFLDKKIGRIEKLADKS